jgi:hypothetical protein
MCSLYRVLMAHHNPYDLTMALFPGTRRAADKAAVQVMGVQARQLRVADGE